MTRLPTSRPTSGTSGGPGGGGPDDASTGDVDTHTVKGGTAPSGDRRIGPYRLLKELGHGGMGTVYLAARADEQYHKRVAIKVVRGAESADLTQRLRRERQILAGLEHPNIARLLDGGSTDEGMPYFVMEYVEGQPIDRYCDAQELSLGARLRLFQQVCAAVQHAHRNLVVHRDIKPSNMLVTSEGVPKLLDFGIAKLLNPELSGEPLTATGLALTPEYASPEQARGEPISTATDVYSLGVVLYKLLTGRLPYRLKSRQPLDVLRAVTEEEPERPSTAVGRQWREGDESPEAASRLHEADVKRLRKRLRGDIDNIVLKALRKEPHKRYASVDAFSEDVRRYLESRPVQARKGTVAYHTMKFVRRNRVPVAAAALLAAGLTAFATVMTIHSARLAAERDRAAREREKAQRVTSVLLDLFRVSEPGQPRDRTITVREIVDKGAERVARELRDEPEVQASLMAELGNVYEGLGAYDKAVPLLEQALSTRKQLLGPQHPDVARNLSDLGNALLHQNADPGRTEAVFRQALELNRKLRGAQHTDVAWSLNRLADTLLYQGRLAEAEPLFRQALDMQRRLLGDEHADVARTLNNLANTLSGKGDHAAAEPLYREAIAINRRILGSDHPHVLTMRANLASLLGRKGDAAAAEALYREVLPRQLESLGEDHPWVFISRLGLADLLFEKRDYAGAERLYLDALASARRRAATDSGGQTDVAEAADRLVSLYEAWRRPKSAAPYRALASGSTSRR